MRMRVSGWHFQAFQGRKFPVWWIRYSARRSKSFRFPLHPSMWIVVPLGGTEAFRIPGCPKFHRAVVPAVGQSGLAGGGLTFNECRIGLGKNPPLSPPRRGT